MGLVGLNYEKNGFDFDLLSNFLGFKFVNDVNIVELDGFNIMCVFVGYSIDLGNSQSLCLGVLVFNLLDEAGVMEGLFCQGNLQISGGEYFVGCFILSWCIFFWVIFDF